jgi:hypothetical protein
MDAKPKQPLFQCSGCGLAVLVIRDQSSGIQVIRGCTCEAPVKAFAQAVMVGRGGVSA